MAVFITSAQEGYGFGRLGLFVCLFACLVSRITLLPEMCLGPRNKALQFGDNWDYDSDP